MFNVPVREMMNYGCLETISEFQVGFRTSNLCETGQILVDGHSSTGLEMNEKIHSRNLATLVSGLAKTKYEPAVLVCKETA